MALNKKKETQGERQTSLIPVIERHEEQIRSELEQVRRDVQDQIVQAQRRAEQRIQEGRLSITELVDEKRKEGLAELQKRSEQITCSLEHRRGRLQQQAKKNRDRAAGKVVNAVMGIDLRTPIAGDNT